MCDDFEYFAKRSAEQANMNFLNSGDSQLNIELPEPSAYQEGFDLIAKILNGEQ